MSPRLSVERAIGTSMPVALVALLGGLVLDGPAASVPTAGAIPAFSRTYRTGCTTCHSAPPKLNALGEAFRLNGYRFPENDQLLREAESTLPLGTEAWKERWPRAIWPAELPAVPPISLRLINDVQVTADDAEPFDWTYRFPAEVHLLSGGSLGEGVGFYAEIHWIPDEGVDLAQAKVPFQDPLPFLPARALNVRVGKQALYLLSTGDPRTDRAGRERFLWSEFDPADLVLLDDEGVALRSTNDLELRDAQPAIELDGLFAGRLLWAVGVAQGSAELGPDPDEFKDVYWKIRWKWGGLGLDGRYDGAEEETPAPAVGGQLLDRGLVLEHFGYRGASRVAGGLRDERRGWGVAVRWQVGRADLGAGWVRGEDGNPWGLDPALGATHESGFVRGEYLLYPWLLASLKAETLDTSLDRGESFALEPHDRTRILPGVVALVRQNVRAVLEGELYTRHEEAESMGRSLPHNLWIRLDVAF